MSGVSNSSSDGRGQKWTRARQLLAVVAVGAAVSYFASFATGDTTSGVGLVLSYASGLLGLVALILGTVVVLKRKR